jgi:hypothetical protein
METGCVEDAVVPGWLTGVGEGEEGNDIPGGIQPAGGRGPRVFPFPLAGSIGALPVLFP